MIGIIAAVTSNGVIGVDGKLPFNYPEDMKHFKENTLNSTVVMGRRTFESIDRPLPKRTNVIITSRPLAIEGVITSTSLETTLDNLKNENVWIIGGASIYEAGLNYADKILLTVTPDIEIRTPCVKFPWINPTIFKISSIVQLPNSSLQIITYQK